MRSWFHIVSYFAVDVATSVLVIGCVISVLTASAQGGRRSVEVSVAAVESMTTYRTPVSVQYALQGEWPKDQTGMREAFPSERPWATSQRLKELHIEDGALTVGLAGPLAGEHITVHPAVRPDDALGPVRWVVGPGGRRSGWTTAGADHTTVQDADIPILLKR